MPIFSASVKQKAILIFSCPERRLVRLPFQFCGDLSGRKQARGFFCLFICEWVAGKIKGEGSIPLFLIELEERTELQEHVGYGSNAHGRPEAAFASDQTRDEALFQRPPLTCAPLKLLRSIIKAFSNARDEKCSGNIFPLGGSWCGGDLSQCLFEKFSSSFAGRFYAWKMIKSLVNCGKVCS